MTADPETRELERHVAQLGEHFATVRIVATTHANGETFCHSLGSGNFYGQIGSVREWLARKDAEVTEAVRRGDG